MDQLTTPDGRYVVVRGRLWRSSNPGLSAERRQDLILELMTARRGVKEALRAGVPAQLAHARSAVDATKVALGERGPAWWSDGASDFNRHLIKNSPYADWYETVRATKKGTEAIKPA
ncbi:MAG: hypothetical protein ABI129_06010 [Rhodanobacter sp.]